MRSQKRRLIVPILNRGMLLEWRKIQRTRLSDCSDCSELSPWRGDRPSRKISQQCPKNWKKLDSGAHKSAALNLLPQIKGRAGIQLESGRNRFKMKQAIALPENSSNFSS